MKSLRRRVSFPKKLRCAVIHLTPNIWIWAFNRVGPLRKLVWSGHSHELLAATVHYWERLLVQTDVAKCCAITSSMAAGGLASLR